MHRREVARVARPAAIGAANRPSEPRSRRLRAAARWPRASPCPASGAGTPPPGEPRRRPAAARRARCRTCRSSSARRSHSSSPAAGTTLNASPLRTTVGTDVRCAGPSRIVQRRHRLRGAREREQRVRALLRRRARVRRAAVREHPQRARGLALDDDRLLPVRRQLAALEAQAGVVAREALGVDEVARAPLLVADEQQRDLREGVRALRERAQHAEREDVAALHVDGPRRRRAGRRRARAGGARSWAWTVSTWPSRTTRPLPLPASVTMRSSAWSADEHGARSTRAPSGTRSSATSNAASATGDVARGRGDGDEALELGGRARGDLRGGGRRSRDPCAWFYLMTAEPHILRACSAPAGASPPSPRRSQRCRPGAATASR